MTDEDAIAALKMVHAANPVAFKCGQFWLTRTQAAEFTKRYWVLPLAPSQRISKSKAYKSTLTGLDALARA
jgi:hypothetical protein